MIHLKCFCTFSHLCCWHFIGLWIHPCSIALWWALDSPCPKHKVFFATKNLTSVIIATLEPTFSVKNLHFLDQKKILCTAYKKNHIRSKHQGSGLSTVLVDGLRLRRILNTDRAYHSQCECVVLLVYICISVAQQRPYFCSCDRYGWIF